MSRLSGSKPTNPEAGFATPAAVVISLAMATIAIAVQARAIAVLHASQADYVRSVAEARLDGAQQVAAGALYTGSGLAQGRGQVDLGDGPVQVTVEPEAAKLNTLIAAKLDPSILARLGASVPGRVASGLARLGSLGGADPQDVAALDPSPTWKICAREAISTYGRAQALTGDRPGLMTARAGEVWRVLAQDGWGWTDDRTVRFTRDTGAPVRVIYRSFYRNHLGRRSCAGITTQPHAA